MPIDPKKTRGFLNNNPGNMDRMPGDKWQGEIRDPLDPRLTKFQHGELTKGRFSVFTAPEWGIRAMAKNLFAYRDRLGIRTVRHFICKWAPPNENDTGAYIASVAGKLGVSPDVAVELDYRTLHALINAIIRVECGGMPYNGSEIEDGLRLAGVVKPVTVVDSATAKAGVAATAATAGSVGIEGLQAPLQSAVETLTPAAAHSQTIATIVLVGKIVLAVVALVGIGWMVWERIKRARRDDAIEGASVATQPEPAIAFTRAEKYA
jgi:hypothetical protein